MESPTFSPDNLDKLANRLILIIIDITEAFNHRAPLIPILDSGTVDRTQAIQEYFALTRRLIQLMHMEVDVRNGLVDCYIQSNPDDKQLALELVGLNSAELQLAAQESHFADFSSDRGRTEETKVLFIKYNTAMDIYGRLVEILSPPKELDWTFGGLIAPQKTSKDGD